MIKQLIRKFIDLIDVSNYEIETDSGWQSISKIGKTIKYDLWLFTLENGLTLKGADDHIVFDEHLNEIYIKDLIVNKTRVMTKFGPSVVINLTNLNKQEYMYDIQVNDTNHRYYSNDILSHNTTIATVYLLHCALFNADKTIAILANKEDTAAEVLRRIKLAYINLPYWLQQGISDSGWNVRTLILENGSKIITGTTGSSSIRSKSVSILYIDEFAHIHNNLAKEFMESVFPTVYSRKTSQIIIVSTPKGLNHFYDIYNGAVKGKNDFYPIRVNWWEVPGRDQKFKESIINTFGLIHWRQEYEAMFVGSTSTLVDPEFLQRMTPMDPILTKYGSQMMIYELPIDDQFYVLGVDASKGVGSDSASIQVLKVINEREVVQVASYKNNKIEPYQFAQVIIEISKFYNEACIIIENNGEGGQTADAIWYGFEYDRIINFDKKGLGIRATKTTKIAACLILKRYIENGWLTINDKDTIRELTTFEESSENIFRATGNQHDDMVSSLYWGLYYLTTQYYDGYGNQERKIEDRFKINDDDEEEGGVMVVDD